MGAEPLQHLVHRTCRSNFTSLGYIYCRPFKPERPRQPTHVDYSKQSRSPSSKPILYVLMWTA
ncbi:hypothetical protein M378DRAFT_172862 [Amanita muscaria Koide BX008]|uniref:Uncharacterized protein n=1 Tax=Amanita muscaria (strain Koide BX008) TaxID=946122 RepID=A0A0C2S0S9_AMAMK|nr:hypothetical protein M378DRAFT_172862 [Amanita muscaria Koide BX008]